MSSANPFDMVIFGGTGDLAMRKLMPALYYRHCAGDFPDDARIIAAARRELDREAYIRFVEERVRKFARPGRFDDEQWTNFAQRLHYVRVATDDGYHALSELLGQVSPRVRVFFLSTSPDLFPVICEQLGAAGAVTENSRVVLEKPLGRDLASSQQISNRVAAIFSEPQTFRIDHYLGKETVQNLMALRFGNAFFEPLWRRSWIRDVQITVAEQVGVEGRGNFYDRTGAMRDMVQNHILQLLCIVAMEPPISIAPDAVRDEKLKVLHSIRPLIGQDAIKHSVRGQYQAGVSQGMSVVGYLDEERVAADSRTETFVALRAELDNWRWAGVPFFLRTGKRLPERMAEIIVTFREVPFSIFGDLQRTLKPNRLVIRLQPNESVRLAILAKTPGDTMRLRTVELDLDLAETYAGGAVDAYERLLTDIIRGRLTLFLRRDELDAAWKWVDPILEAWELYGERPKPYMSGTWGPAASTALIGRDGLTWSEEG